MDRVKRAFRLWQVWLLMILMVGVVYLVAPQQLPILIYKGTAIGLGGVGGFWLHAWLSGPADRVPFTVQMHYYYQRTAIICASMLAIALMV